MTGWDGRRVFVTGATGMVGSWLVRALLDKGAHVVVLIRDPDPQSELLRSGTIARTTVTNGALENHGDLERAVVEHDIEVIFHLGAQTIVGTADRAPRLTFEANVQGTWNVLEAARLHADMVRAVVVASSDKAYGASEELPYVETMPLSGRAPYEVSKSCTDLIANTYAASYGTPVTIARCGNIFGGGDVNWSRLVPGTMRSLLLGEQPIIRSDGTFKRDYIFVDDVVDAYLTLGRATEEGSISGEAYNFSDERPLTVMDMYNAIADVAGQRPEPRVLNAASAEIKDQYLDSGKARASLGWKPKFGRDEGLRRTWAWYAELLGGAS